MPTISIIIPAYNAEQTILETINSVLEQTFSDFEIIIVNDGSTDKTLEVVQSIEDERLKVFCYENSGVSGARNRGISHAIGDYISFLDADDLWTPDKLELQLAALKAHSEAGVAYSWVYTINETGEILKPFDSMYEGNVYADLLKANFLTSGSNPLITRAAIDSVGEFDIKLAGGEDWDYWLRLAAKWHFVVVPKYQVFYRRSMSSNSFKLQKMREDTLIMLDKVMQMAPPELQYLKKESLSNIYRYIVELYIDSLNQNSQVDIRFIVDNLWKYIKTKPETLKNIYTYKLIIKILLIIIISPTQMNNLLEFIRKVKSQNKFQVQS
ncbi:putative glycosyl transferase [Nostoc sp. NIES-3756]|uniref:glycosyltransferase family 2 protein n=1 Tax=Nostoc sp. NIES-3756 TaxID=1751286 RepID=UPI000721CD4F|nr:glycosyltransferase [Nostoc sp. NIES-3756]BAT54333.1 putative glycosyl transferase [Nostoc sp. NIES-3756]